MISNRCVGSGLRNTVSQNGRREQGTQTPANLGRSLKLSLQLPATSNINLR